MANTYTAYVNPRYTRNERELIGREIVNFIVARTKAGKGPGGNKFRSANGSTSYTKSYREDTDFKTAGKKPSPINLTLTGDMLDSLDVLDIEFPGRIVIGYVEGFENDKAGYMKDKGFDFLRLSQEELNTILSNFGQPSTEIAPARISTSFIETFIRGLGRGR